MASNYVTDDEGSTFIAPTQRPDGTWRKPIKVKDGYVPQDEVPLYESKGKATEISQPEYPVGFSEEYVRQVREAALKKQGQQSIPGLSASVTNSKKKKKKSGSEKPKAASEEGLLETRNYSSNELPKAKDDEWTTVGGKNKIAAAPAVAIEKVVKKKVAAEKPKPVEREKPPQIPEKTPPTAADASDPAKRVKNLRKRLREMEQIEEKRSTGVKLEPEQLEKLSRKKEVEREITRLLKQFNIS